MSVSSAAGARGVKRKLRSNSISKEGKDAKDADDDCNLEEPCAKRAKTSASPKKIKRKSSSSSSVLHQIDLNAASSDEDDDPFLDSTRGITAAKNGKDAKQSVVATRSNKGSQKPKNKSTSSRSAGDGDEDDPDSSSDFVMSEESEAEEDDEYDPEDAYDEEEDDDDRDVRAEFGRNDLNLSGSSGSVERKLTRGLKKRSLSNETTTPTSSASLADTLVAVSPSADAASTLSSTPSAVATSPVKTASGGLLLTYTQLEAQLRQSQDRERQEQLTVKRLEKQCRKTKRDCNREIKLRSARMTESTEHAERLMHLLSASEQKTAALENRLDPKAREEWRKRSLVVFGDINTGGLGNASAGASVSAASADSDDASETGRSIKCVYCHETPSSYALSQALDEHYAQSTRAFVTGCNHHHVLCSNCVTRIILTAKFSVAVAETTNANLVWMSERPGVWNRAMCDFAGSLHFYEPKIEDRLTVLTVMLREACERHAETRFCFRDMHDCMEHVTRSACGWCYVRADMHSGIPGVEDETPAQRDKRLADIPYWVDWVEKLTPVSPLLLKDSCERFCTVMTPRFLPDIDAKQAYARVRASDGLDIACPLGCVRRVPLAGTKFGSIRRLLQVNLEDMLFEILRHVLCDCMASSICEVCRDLGLEDFTYASPRALMTHMAEVHFKNSAPRLEVKQPVTSSASAAGAGSGSGASSTVEKSIVLPATSARLSGDASSNRSASASASLSTDAGSGGDAGSGSGSGSTSNSRVDLGAGPSPSPSGGSSSGAHGLEQEDKVAPPRALVGEEGDTLIPADNDDSSMARIKPRHLHLKSTRERERTLQRHRESSFYLSDNENEDDDQADEDASEAAEAAEHKDDAAPSSLVTPSVDGEKENNSDGISAGDTTSPLLMANRRVTRGMSMRSLSRTPTRPTRSSRPVDLPE